MFQMQLDHTDRKVIDDAQDVQTHPFDEIARHDQVDFDTARQRHDQLLDAVNADIAREIPGAVIVPAPLCPSACQPGPLAEFLLMLNCDPFGPLNMRYAAGNADTAELLDTHEYSPEMAERYDTELVAFFKRAEAAWQDFKAISPDATRIDVFNHRDTLRAVISQATERIDERDDTDLRHLWRGYLAANLKTAA